MAEPRSLPLEQLARAADLCLPPWLHAVRLSEPAGEERNGADADPGRPLDWTLRIEARDAAGVRQPWQDLELEIYRSGRELNLMLSRLSDEQAPLLWHGRHPVWLHPESGERCPRPDGGAPMEALCRRLRALLGENPAGGA